MDMDINKAIYRYLDENEIKHSNAGFRYLITSIKIGLSNPELCHKIVNLYQNVAEIHETEAYRVERSIRHCLLHTSQSNKEFIMRAIDNLSCNNSSICKKYTRNAQMVTRV